MKNIRLADQFTGGGIVDNAIGLVLTRASCIASSNSSHIIKFPTLDGISPNDVRGRSLCFSLATKGDPWTNNYRLEILSCWYFRPGF